MSEKPLSGRVAIVTGAGRNIGRAIALQLAEDGAAIVVNVRSNKEQADKVVAEIAAAGGQAAACVADIADPDAVAKMAQLALDRFGGIDILVNNAALRDEKSITEMTYADWRKVMSVTLDGAFHCVKACLEPIRASGQGRIINIGGLSAHTGSKDRAHVVTAKAGFVGFTRALAHDLAQDGVTANCVIPGLIGTPRPSGKPEPQHHLTNSTITGARGTPDDVAAAVRFLCSPAAQFITGQSVHVSGGAYLGS